MSFLFVTWSSDSCQLCVNPIVVCDLEQRQRQKGGKEGGSE